METRLKLGREVQGFALNLLNCTRCKDSISAVLAIKQEVRFLDTRPNNPDRTGAAPEKTELDDHGSIAIGLSITHPNLALDSVSLGLNWKLAVADFTFDARNSSARFHQTNSPQGETAEEIVQGLVKLAEVIAPILGPTYGTVDISSSKLMSRRIRKFTDVRYWCYANIFSSGLMKSAPADFFAEIPNTVRATLTDGSMLLRYNDSFANWYFSPPKDIENYLAANAPKLQLLRRVTKK